MTGSYVAGRWVDGSYVDTTIDVCPQPMSTDDLMLLPEGMRTKGAVKLYTLSLVKSADEASAVKTPPDEITYDGLVYQVQQTWKWRVGILDHYKVIAVRKEK
jgi:hypothetical protein